MARGRDFEFVIFSTKPLYCPEADAMTGGFVKPVPGEIEGEEIVTEVLSALASFPAERLLCPHVTHFDQVFTTCATDWSIAEELCDQFDWDVYRLLADAGRWVRKLAMPIFRLAAELQTRGRLTYQDVLELCPEVAAEGMAFLEQVQAAA
jgi:hypothetical protein